LITNELLYDRYDMIEKCHVVSIQTFTECRK
ncbi:hypothetical protein T08_7479, partial [Trichinella sp. T8]